MNKVEANGPHNGRCRLNMHPKQTQRSVTQATNNHGASGFSKPTLLFVVVSHSYQNQDYTYNLKVLDQITLENKFCSNFKIRSVFI